eukprot:m.50836 g.50836  ORF g.50836 m.50836 type:complete len:547 (+) comp7266_c0_seq1:81-1721(+)
MSTNDEVPTPAAEPAAASAAPAADNVPTALQIIGLNKEGTSFEILDENLDKILNGKAVRGLPAVVVSVAGPFRLGKSFLLNYFVRYLDGEVDAEKGWIDQTFSPDHNMGFKWSHGADRHTTGVWMFKRPFVRTMPGGKKVAVLLVDTQGTFDNHMKQEMNAIIFALNSLISSIQVYNVTKRISEDVLQNMHLFTRFGEMAYKQQTHAGANKSKIKPFQRLQFLIRDWGGKRDFDFGAEGGKGYLETVLNSQDGVAELLEVRRDIKTCFGKIDCFLMPHPGQEVAEGDSGNIDDRFKEHLEAFVPSVLKSDRLEVKTVMGQPVTCGTLKDYIRQYTKLFKDGSMPEVTNIFDATAKLNHDGIRRESVASYKQNMREFAGPTQPHRVPAELEAKHDEFFDQSIKLYTEAPRLEAPRVEQETLEEMHKEIKEIYADISSANEQKVLFKRLVTPISLGGLSLICNIIATFLSMFGMESLAILFGYITWFCFLTIAFWAYSSAFHKFEDVAKQIDELSVHIYETGMTVFATYVQQQLLGAAGGGTDTKKSK